jgi:membrane protease YdiL (CAAX protease family)
VYVLVEGRADLVKRASLGSAPSPIGELGVGDTFGEVKIVDRQPSSASVVAATDAAAIAIDLDVLDRQAELAAARAIVWKNVGQILAERLRRTSVTGADAIRRELAESESRAYAGRFLLFVFCMIAVPQLAFAALATVPATRHLPDALLSLAFIVLTAAPVWLALRRSPLPPRSCGLTLEGGWRHALTALAWSIPILLLLTVVKLAAVRWVPAMAGRPLLDPDALDGHAAAMLLYAVDAPFREFLARAVLQGSLQHFLRVPPGEVSWRAIAMSNLLFASGQGFRGLAFSVASFAMGLFWGWLFARQGSLIGAIASHVLVGWWGLFALGLRGVLGRG